jgi:predicted anti-sigma-YlaC factor YlaD
VTGRLRLGIKKLHLDVKARGIVFDAAHEAIQNMIGPYLGGTCENGQREVIETHLELCAGCRQLARRFRRQAKRPKHAA